MERAGESFNQHGVCSKFSEAAGFPQGQYALNLPVSLFIEASLHHSAPQHGEAKGPFRTIVGGLNTIFEKKDPEMGRLTVQMFCGSWQITVKSV